MLVPTLAHRFWWAVARTTMTRSCGLGLLLVLVLPVVSTSRPGAVVRLNKAVLSYGKRHAAELSCVGLCTSVCP